MFSRAYKIDNNPMKWCGTINSGKFCRNELPTCHYCQSFLKTFFYFQGKWMKPHFIVLTKFAFTTMSWATCPILFTGSHAEPKTKSLLWSITTPECCYTLSRINVRYTFPIYKLTENRCEVTSNAWVSKSRASKFFV